MTHTEMMAESIELMAFVTFTSLCYAIYISLTWVFVKKLSLARGGLPVNTEQSAIVNGRIKAWLLGAFIGFCFACALFVLFQWVARLPNSPLHSFTIGNVRDCRPFCK